MKIEQKLKPHESNILSNILVSVTIKKEFEDIIKSFFITKCLNSVVIKDPLKLPGEIKHALYDEQDKKEGFVKITSTFPFRKKYLKNNITLFLERLTPEYKINFTIIPKENNEWKSFYKGVEIEGIIKIIPPWLVNESKEKRIIQIDPGAGFGTGDHATSRLCLNQLKNIQIQNRNVADLGCGSGILGITCKKFGANRILMLEHDINSVNNAKHNAKLNGVENDVDIRHFDLMKKKIPGLNKFDVIFCNIWPHVNKHVALLNAQNFKKNTQILFTGVFKKDHENFNSFLLKNGYKILDIKTLKDWYLYIATFKKNILT